MQKQYNIGVWTKNIGKIRGEIMIQKNKSKKIECFEKEYPNKLLKIREYPQKLYYLGNVELLNNKKIVAIVGSRKCSEYGRKYARYFAKELSKRNICIISGLAIGIDAAAHDGAVTEEGRTIAVLGGGLQHIYPTSNLWLFNRILENNGLIITEHSDEEETLLEGFPKRNRIITGIADAVLVVEANHRSGSKISAEYAFKQGKKVYCIPRGLDEKNNSGIIELIENGAKIVSSPSKLIKDLYGEKIDVKNRSDENNKKIKTIPVQYEKAYSILKKELSREEIALKLNNSIREVNILLTHMEMEGFIVQTKANIFKRIE